MSNAYFGAGPSESPEVIFDRGFGGVLQVEKDPWGGSSAEYFNPYDGKDLRADICKGMIDKAMKVMQKQSIDTQTGGAGTAGTALIPVYVDPSVVDRTNRMTPLTELLPRRAVRGLTYDYIPLTAKGGAQWNFEDAALADQVDTYNRTSVAIKFLYSVGRITGPSIAAMRGFIDPTALEEQGEGMMLIGEMNRKNNSNQLLLMDSKELMEMPGIPVKSHQLETEVNLNLVIPKRNLLKLKEDQEKKGNQFYQKSYL